MDPLIVSPAAKRRLRTLLGHGVNVPNNSFNIVEDGLVDSSGGWVRLEADMLDMPVQVPPEEETKLLWRDAMMEVALSRSSLDALGVSRAIHCTILAVPAWIAWEICS